MTTVWGRAGQCTTIALIALWIGYVLRGRVALWRYQRALRRAAVARLAEDAGAETVRTLARIGTPQLVRDDPSDDEHATSYEDRMG